MGEKYDSERKQVILSPTELKDNVWIDIFQAGVIDVSRELISCRWQDSVMSLWDKGHIYIL